jgi:hypothetical protein
VATHLRQLKARIVNIGSADIFDLLLHLFILTAPIITYGVFVFGISWRISRFFLILIIPAIIYQAKKRPQVIFRDKFLLFAVVPFLIFTSLSILWTPENSISFGYNRLATMYEVMLIYIIFIMADLNLERFLSFTKSYLISAIFPLGIGLWQIANNIFRFSTTELPFSHFLISGKYEIFKNRHAFITDEKYSRLTSCFAEPTIFGSFLASVLLLSLLIEAKDKISTITLRLFQITTLACLTLSLSKMAVIIFIFGLIIIFRKERNILSKLLAGLFLIFISIYGGIYIFAPDDYITRRLFTDSGHFILLKNTIQQLNHINLFHGAGVGSIPNFTTNKFLLSRVYEGGLVGLLFVIYVSYLPFKILFQKTDHIKIKNVCLGLLGAILLGFHLYDNFLYIWPWIIIGLIMSLFYHLKEVK